ncbi:MAG TPA: DUF6151 family protein [Kofleriaceae bacterium]|nr:DUF6151 family protein [Kofleriaceae bacterium]
MMIPLRCQCGAVRGELELSRRKGQRVVCYCDDCQAFPRFLERPEVLDAHGGSDLWQTRPAMVRIAGMEQVACMRLSDKGMLRWYASCCRTPIANTHPSARLPFVGLHTGFLDPGASGRALDEVLGPPMARVQGRFAIGGMPEGAERSVSPGTIARTAAMLVRAALARGHRPSPFFHPSTGKPRIEPRVLSAAERQALS